MTALAAFALSAFLSAALLFVVEPMVARMMLPLVGGTPAIWNTCLVFFQAALLGGYLYAHASMKWLGRRAQMAVHLLVVLLPALPLGLLPLHLPPGWEPPAQSNPVPWILGSLSLAVGAPFLALASNAPVMQRWLAAASPRHDVDPYFLYAASNAGSLIGLFAYPVAIEPTLHLGEQSRLWTYGYLAFVALTIVCAALAWRQTDRVPAAVETEPEPSAGTQWRERLRWIALAFVPSSLMLGVTTALTTDVAAMPLFWILPLAVYLITFVLVFARRSRVSHEWLVRRLPLLILIGVFPLVARMKLPLAVLAVLYLTVLFGIAMVCHGELARSRPPVRRLTEFYLVMSAGGVLGGCFNAVLAPVLFPSAIEFPLVLVFAAWLRPAIGAKPPTPALAARARRRDWLLPLALGLCLTAVILGLARAGITMGYSLTVLVFGYSLIWCLSFGRRPLRFALGVAALLIAGSFYTGPFGRVLATHRSYFGVYRVTDDPSGRFRYLISGGTLHGVQSLDPARAREPLAYYTRGGPAGQIARAVTAGTPHGASWAVVGLGAGAMACLTDPAAALTYYEIDPLVVRLATDERYFTFLKQCAPRASVIVGDARLELRHAPDAGYQTIVLDAFSGDAIPIHLMTREAVALYLTKLAPGGIIAFHISNLYLQLAPTLARVAEDAHLFCLAVEDRVVSGAEAARGKNDSRWLVMARDEADLAGLVADPESPLRWVPARGREDAPVWTDDYSSLLSVTKWNGFVGGIDVGEGPDRIP
jgi:hypothetical protein